MENLFVLVHDAWLSGWVWDDLIARLAERDLTAVALDLPGHSPDSLTVPDLTLETYASSVVEFAKAQQATYKAKKLILIGHGTGGAVVQMATERLGAAVGGLVFAGAYVLRDGESIAGQMPPEQADFFLSLAEGDPHHRIDLTPLADFWRFNVINDDQRRADELLTRLVPEPAGPLFEKVSLKTFGTQHPPAAYISFNEDMSLPPGSFYPRMANKLGPHRHLTVNAGHLGILTKPREVAEALVFLISQGLK